MTQANLFDRMPLRITIYWQAMVDILRDGVLRRHELKLTAQHRLIPEHLSQRPPSYLLIAGFVFTQASSGFEETAGACSVQVGNIADQGRSSVTFTATVDTSEDK